MPYLMPPYIFTIDLPTLHVSFGAEVLAHFDKLKQDAFWKCEAGGQLFAKITDSGRWEIVKATGPRRSDYRRRFRFFPRRTDEQIEIGEMFKVGLHYVGDWHTHPELIPTPSPMDMASLEELVRESKHELLGFLMVIVGTGSAPSGLWVSFHPPSGSHQQMLLADSTHR